MAEIYPINRRVAFKQAAGALGGATLAGIATSGRAIASGAGMRATLADPLPALCARRAEIDAICNANPGIDTYDLLFGEWQTIQDVIADTVATTPAGIAAQMRFLVWFQSEFEWDDTCDRLVASVIAGVERIGGVA